MSQELLDLRKRLADAEEDVTEAIYRENVERARAEQRAIEDAPDGHGKNAEERERFLILWLESDAIYQLARIDLRHEQADLALRRAELDAYLDDVRRQRIEATHKLADALTSGGLVAEVVA